MSGSPLISRSSSVVSPASAEDNIGWGLKLGLGGTTTAFVSWAITEIPKQIEGIDKKADPFLEQLISLLDQLGKSWKESTKPDLYLVAQVIESLTTFADHPDKAQLLYPQIMNLKPSTSNTVQKEQLEKKDEATQKAQGIFINQVMPLLQALKENQSLSLASKNTSEQSLKLIGELSKELKEIAQEQRSLLAKVVHVFASLAMQTIKEQWEKFSSQKKDEFTINNHPLMQLLAIIGKYQLNTFYLLGDKKRELTKAFRDLETQFPIFNGIYDSTKEHLSAPDIDVKKVHTRVTEFIRQTLISKLSEPNKKEVHTQVESLIKNRKYELISQLRLQCKKEKDEARTKADDELAKKYKEIEGEGIIQNFTQNAMKLVGQGTNKKDVAYTVAFKELQQVEAELDQKYENKIKNIEHDDFWKNIDAKYVKSIEAFCNGTSQDIPKEFFDQIAIDEILWKAVAYQQQKEELQDLSKKLIRKNEEDPKAIIKSLQLAIEYLQRAASIAEGLSDENKGKLIKPVIEYVLHWMDFAKEQMMTQEEQDSSVKDKIDSAFEEAVKMLRKGEVISSIQLIKNFVSESSYWNKLWKDSPSPIGVLTEVFKAFCQTTPPPKPPKSAPDVHKLLGHNEGASWEATFLEEANKIEKEQVFENALAFTCFEFVARFLNLNGDKTGQYKRLIGAMDEIKALEDVNSDNLNPILKKFLGQDSLIREKKILDSLTKCINTYKDKKEFHKQLYLQLVNILINERGNNYSVSTWVAWSFFSLVYDLVELFIRPFSEQLFSEIDGLFKNPTGTLNQKHLVPIKGITKGLSTYLIAMNSWEQEITRQNLEQRSTRSPGKVLIGTKEDLKILLNRPDRYDGMTPDQIMLKTGFAIVNQIQLPNYAKIVEGWMNNIENFAWKARVNNSYLNALIIAGQWSVSRIPYVMLFVGYYAVKVITSVINFSVQQAGKLYLWKSHAMSWFLDQMLDSFFVDAESVPILDTLLLEQLEDLLKELKKGTPPANPETAAGDDRNKKVIGEAIQHLFEVIEMDKHDSIGSMKSRSKEDILHQAKKQAYEQLKKLLATVVVNTSKSLLQKESFDALLFSIFRIGNEGLRGGKKVVLTQEQRVELTKRLHHAPNEEEINQEGKKIALENIGKIPKVLAEIRAQAVNPAIDKAIDESAQTSSQFLLDYITWMQSRLFSPKENGSNRNIIQFLKKNLAAYQTEGADKDEIIRDIHFVYAQFMQEMIEFQSGLDAHPSPNSPELNELILKEVAPLLKDLTLVIKDFVQDKQVDQCKTCSNKLLELEVVQVKVSNELGKIEEGEKNRVMGQAGLQGIVQTKFAEAIHSLKDGSKGISHTVVRLEIDHKVDELRNMNNNKILLKHMLLWQMRLFLNPELAFKA